MDVVGIRSARTENHVEDLEEQHMTNEDKDLLTACLVDAGDNLGVHITASPPSLGGQDSEAWGD